MVLDDELETGLVKVAADFEPEPTLADDPGILYFTSGTTGPPTMVLHTQASYDLAHRVTGERWLCCTHDALEPCRQRLGQSRLVDRNKPLRAAARGPAFSPWIRAGRFEAVAALRTPRVITITTWCAPPTALRRIVREELAAYRFPHLAIA